MLVGPKTYNELPTLLLYCSYLDGQDTLSKLTESVVPLVSRVVHRVWKKPEMDLCEHEITALERAYTVLKDKRVPPIRKVFTAYLTRCIVQGARWGGAALASQEFDFDYGCKRYALAEMTDPGDLDRRLHIRDILAEFKEELLSAIRFRSPEYDVCLFALRELMDNLKVSKKFLAIRYSLPIERVEWLYRYTTCLSRVTLQRVYDESQSATVFRHENEKVRRYALSRAAEV